jgi:hypothetical protein
MLDAAQSRAHASELPGSDLQSMIATLNSYESIFGPYHLQTVALAVQIARVLWSVGELQTAQRLSERSVKYLVRGGDQANSLRMSALTILRDSLLKQGDSEQAVAVQREIVEWAARLAGQDTQEGEKAELARMLMSAGPGVVAA